MFADDDIVLISAIEHYAYCPRQFGLIHVEQVYEENVFTLQGNALHERADEALTSCEEGKRVERALPLWSDRYGLLGKADVVEFYADGRVWPVEYKRGARRRRLHDELQLCAQALCLEEMLGVAVPRGTIFYHASRGSREVEITEGLRGQTLRAVEEIRALLRAGRLPPPANDARCTDCSLRDACQPAMVRAAAGGEDEGLFRAEDAEP
jgi:CRISPR-associated exonuclease Cas4